MAEHSPVAAGEHGRDPSPLIAECWMSKGIDTAMKAVEASTVVATNCRWGKAGGAQLRG